MDLNTIKEIASELGITLGGRLVTEVIPETETWMATWGDHHGTVRFYGRYDMISFWLDELNEAEIYIWPDSYRDLLPEATPAHLAGTDCVVVSNLARFMRTRS